MYKKSLAINEKLGLLEGMASDYGNLGIVLQTRGDLDGAEEMHKKSLEIDEKLGRLEGMAKKSVEEKLEILEISYKPEAIWMEPKKCIKSLWQ